MLYDPCLLHPHDYWRKQHVWLQRFHGSTQDQSIGHIFHTMPAPNVPKQKKDIELGFPPGEITSSTPHTLFSKLLETVFHFWHDGQTFWIWRLVRTRGWNFIHHKAQKLFGDCWCSLHLRTDQEHRAHAHYTEWDLDLRPQQQPVDIKTCPDSPTHPLNGLSIHTQIENAARWVQQPVQTQRSYFSRNHLANLWGIICLHWPIHHFDCNAIFPFLEGTMHEFST